MAKRMLGPMFWHACVRAVRRCVCRCVCLDLCPGMRVASSRNRAQRPMRPCTCIRMCHAPMHTAIMHLCTHASFRAWSMPDRAAIDVLAPMCWHRRACTYVLGPMSWHACADFQRRCAGSFPAHGGVIVCTCILSIFTESAAFFK